MGIAENILWVKERIAWVAERAGRSPEGITLVAVIKGVEPARVEEAFRAGLRHFGENRVQEAQAKREALRHLAPASTWHLVGHLQTNKAKTAVALFDIIHSVDSLRIAQALSQRASRRLPVLLEVNVSGEPTKSGFTPGEAARAADEIARLPHLEVRGLMTVAPMVKEAEETRPFFRRLRELAQALGLPELSMGMTDDFEVAVEEGATLVRIGRAIFGPRP